MSEKCLFIVRALAFFLILSFLIVVINYILTPKKYYDEAWSTTSTYKGFYQMKKDSVDVLFLGSSHAASGFNPQEIYNHAGIRSYNLGCEQQSLLVSYYWLKEALKYQKPKAVILDTYMLFEYNHVEALNTAESCTRMAMDAMRWSPVKYEAIKAICDHDELQTFNSYLFKNIRFHTRWTNLTEQDFTFSQLEDHFELKGFSALNKKGIGVNPDYQPYADFDTTECEDPDPLMIEYLDQIRKLCDEKQIRLVLVKTPANVWSIRKHNYTAGYAAEHNIDFIDFNTKEFFDACGFIFAEDMHDNGHSNIWGAEKLSVYLSDVLREKYGIGGGEYGEQWADTDAFYRRIRSDCELKYITDLDAYIKAIDQERYTVLIGVRNDMTQYVNEDVKAAFSRLGLKLNAEKYDGYYAAISDYNTVECAGHELLKYSGSTRDKLQNFSIVSGGYDAGAQCSIKIGNTEYAKNWNGFNIVVYSEETRKVLDTAVYNGELRR